MTGQAKLLVVDDDPIMRSLYEEALGTAFALRTAASGSECLQAMQAWNPAAVLLDVEMPGLNGYETCRRLRAAHPDAPPVLFVSVHDQLSDRMRGYDAGGSDYVCKPWQGPELVCKIERLLAGAAERRALAAERDEAVQVSADMAGELGVVLDFQRELYHCRDYRGLAEGVLQALARYGLEGSVRIAGRQGVLEFSGDGPCTALETSILETIAAQTDGPRVRPIQRHTSFNYGGVVLFVRELAMLRDADHDAAMRERMGRAVDNLALLLEAAVTRLAALDSGRVAQDLERLQRLVALTTRALDEVARRHSRLKDILQHAFAELGGGLERSLMQLGLTGAQEDFLSDLVHFQSQKALDALEQDRETEQLLRRIVAELSVGH